MRAVTDPGGRGRQQGSAETEPLQALLSAVGTRRVRKDKEAGRSDCSSEGIDPRQGEKPSRQTGPPAPSQQRHKAVVGGEENKPCSSSSSVFLLQRLAQ